MRPRSPPTARTRCRAIHSSKVRSIQNQINTLNAQSKDIAGKIDQLQDKVQNMQASDLPNAQRQEQRGDKKARLKQMRDTYEQQAKGIEQTSSGGNSVTNQADKTDLKRQQALVGTDAAAAISDGANSSLQLRVSWKNLQVSDSSSIKSLVSAFQLHLSVVGDGSDTARRANTATTMPYTPGTGLPPVGTP